MSEIFIFAGQLAQTDAFSEPPEVDRLTILAEVQPQLGGFRRWWEA